MDNWYRFGKVEVSCEGYNNPDDPYILRGSCGLEYTLELTAEGRQNQGSFRFSDFASGFFQGKQQHGSSQQFQSGLSAEGSGSLVVIALFLLLAFAVYKMFLCDSGRGAHGDGYRGNQGPDGAGYNNMGPPPPGFRSEYTGMDRVLSILLTIRSSTSTSQTVPTLNVSVTNRTAVPAHNVNYCQLI